MTDNLTKMHIFLRQLLAGGAKRAEHASNFQILFQILSLDSLITILKQATALARNNRDGGLSSSLIGPLDWIDHSFGYRADSYANRFWRSYMTSVRDAGWSDSHPSESIACVHSFFVMAGPVVSTTRPEREPP